MQVKSKTKNYCSFYSIKKLESAICVEPIDWERGQYDFTHRELQKWTELIVKKQVSTGQLLLGTVNHHDVVNSQYYQAE